MKKQQHHRFEILDHLATSGILRALEVPIEDRGSEVIRLADYIEKGDPLRSEEFELVGNPGPAHPANAGRGIQGATPTTQWFDEAARFAETGKLDPVPGSPSEESTRFLRRLLSGEPAGPPEGVVLKDGEYWCESHQEVHSEADKPSVGATLAELLGGLSRPARAKLAENVDQETTKLRGTPNDAPPPPAGITEAELRASVEKFIDNIGGESAASTADVELKTTPTEEVQTPATPDPRPWKARMSMDRISRDRYRQMSALGKGAYYWAPRSVEELESSGETQDLPGATSAEIKVKWEDPYPLKHDGNGHRISRASYETYGKTMRSRYREAPRTREEFDANPLDGREADQPRPAGRPIKDQPQA